MRGNEEFLSVVNELFNEKIPFNKLLGLKVESISRERVSVGFRMRDELMGHYQRGMVHGGAISAVLDVTGGLAAFMGVQEKMAGETLEAKLERFGRVSTIDIRVDFLRPGIGKKFIATAYALRTGKKVAVTRIELHNEKKELIAVGTGSYIVA
ncbi:MAG TPA: thioesterase family protein [Syntrophorhabdaceae bacterium]|nr:thioesterase family protein [Syntrophorhabdaceae bacterium]